MEKSSRLRRLWGKYKWIIPASFIASLVFSLTAIALCRVRGFDGMESYAVFNIGADIVSLCICTVLLYSLAQDKDGFSAYTVTFAMLIFFTAALLFSDAAWWVVEGISGLRLWNLLINVFRFIVTTMLIFYFWRYVVTALRLDGAYRRIADIIMNILLVPAVLACFANLFVPLYFSISDDGVYFREPLFLWSQLYFGISDSIFAPESVTVSGTGSAVFARSTASVNNSYYFYALGEDSDNQGKQGYSVTAGENVTLALSGEETQYKVSGITACKNNSSLQYNGTCYAGEEDEVSLTLSHPDTPEGYIFSGYKASAGALNEGVLTKPAENVTISGGFEFADGVGTRLVGRSISVEGDVGVNFYMEIDPEIAASETAYIQFTIPTGDKTETETIPVSEAERKDGCYVFQCDVAAKEMTSEIKAQIIDPESGKSGAVYTYSVKEYADALLSHTEGNWKFTKVAPLVKSMLNYGTAAQNYFDRNTKKPANADLSDEDRTLGEITNQLDAWENYKDIRGIVQLVHGKNEHKGRYIAFMRFLASNGFLTIINDHRGHGESIIDP